MEREEGEWKRETWFMGRKMTLPGAEEGALSNILSSRVLIIMWPRRKRLGGKGGRGGGGGGEEKEVLLLLLLLALELCFFCYQDVGKERKEEKKKARKIYIYNRNKWMKN